MQVPGSVAAQLSDDYFVLFPDKRGQTSLFNSMAQGPRLCGRAASTFQHPTLHEYSLRPPPRAMAPTPQSFGKGKPPSDQSELWLSRGWRQTLWKHWLLSIPSGLGGAEVRKSNQEREQRKYQQKKGEGDRENVADITQLRRGSCTWKIHHQCFL